MNWTSGDYLAPLRQIDKTITIKGTCYPEYTWLEPVLRPLRADYRTLQDKYTDAIIGNTCKPADEAPPMHVSKINYLVRTRYLGKKNAGRDTWNVQIWLKANQYTQAKRDRMVDCREVSIMLFDDQYDLYNRYIKDMILNIIKV